MQTKMVVMSLPEQDSLSQELHELVVVKDFTSIKFTQDYGSTLRDDLNARLKKIKEIMAVENFDPTVQDSMGQNILHRIFANGRLIQVFEELPKTTWLDDGLSAKMRFNAGLVRTFHRLVVRFIVRHLKFTFSALSAADIWGNTPFHEAVTSGCPIDYIRVFLVSVSERMQDILDSDSAREAVCTFIFEPKNCFGKTPLDLAKKYESRERYEQLLKVASIFVKSADSIDFDEIALKISVMTIDDRRKRRKGNEDASIPMLFC